MFLILDFVVFPTYSLFIFIGVIALASASLCCPDPRSVSQRSHFDGVLCGKCHAQVRVLRFLDCRGDGSVSHRDAEASC